MLPDYDYGDYDDDDDEHVSGLIVRPPEEEIQLPIYRSKYRKSVQEEANLNKHEHKTLGVMRVSLSAPDQFLKKNSGIHPIRPEVKHKHYRIPDYQHQLPKWEPVKLSQLTNKPSELSNNSRGSSKNFKKENILNAKKARRHSTSNLPSSTATLDIFGNQLYKFSKRHSDKNIRPRYLDRPLARSEINLKDMKKNPTGKSDEPDSKVSSGGSTSKREKSSKKSSEQPKGRYVTDEERAELLDGMKKKWDELMRQFQALPFLADTPPKAKRKAKMEENLKQLEKDIDEIERHPHIYVYDDDDDDNNNDDDDKNKK